LPRKRKSGPSLAELNREIDRKFVREDLSGTLRAGLLFANTELDQASLIAAWLSSTVRSDDLGGKRGLDQEPVTEVLEAARCVLELVEPLQSDLVHLTEVSTRFVASVPPRPLSILAAAAALAAWEHPGLVALAGGRQRLHFGWAPLESERPWLQVLPAFHMDWVTDALQGMVQFEAVADSWSESTALAELIPNNLPFTLQKRGLSLSLEKSHVSGLVQATWDEWPLCRSILRVSVRAEV